MKPVLATLALISTLTLTACTKTENATTTMATTPPTDLNVEVEVEGGEIVVMIDGEEQALDISEILSCINLKNVDGEVQVHMFVNGEEVDGLPDGMMSRVMNMMGGHGRLPEGMGEMHARMMHEQRDGSPEGMEEMHARMMHERGGGPHVEWRMHDREISEEEQFMQELGMLGSVSEYLEHNEAVALMGIHMIRHELEGEMRMEALEEIIEGTDEGSAVRNAALIVAIQTMQEHDDIKAATDLMVELVLSN